MNIINLLTVGKIILNENTPSRKTKFEHYLIPYYQRGYRWDEEHVHALLNDVHAFMLSDEKKYCLQPIVVVPRSDEEGNNIWEVIDGQQRLITMNIIFNYLNRPRYSIIFEKRAKSTTFLKELSSETYEHDNPDFHFMSQAFLLVKNWFEQKTQNDVGYIDEFNSTLTKKVEVIWYQIEELKGIANNEIIEGKKIDIFNRLNIGKIPLTDSELIRALLLSKVKHGLTEREAVLRQAEISNEWHRMEMEMRDEKFWYFINNKALEETSSCIEFIFNLIAQNNNKRYSTYLWFEKEIKSDNPEQERLTAMNLWNQTKDYFSKLKHWYTDSHLYHHIGFILASGDNSISNIKNIIENSRTAKSVFNKWVFDEVKKELSHININSLTYEKSKPELKKIFLLHSILLTASLKSGRDIKFPFDLFKKVENDGGWSIEHIHAQQSKEMKDEKAIRRWLQETYKAVEEISSIEKYSNVGAEKHENIELSEELKASIQQMLSSAKIDVNKFNLLKTELVQIFDSESVHLLDNLALLSKRGNSSLSNAIFPVKRQKIIEMEKEGIFVPLATKNIFLKYYSSSDLQPYFWSKGDKTNYFEDIKKNLQPYLTQY